MAVKNDFAKLFAEEELVFDSKKFCSALLLQRDAWAFPQEVVPDLPGRTADGSQTRRAQAGLGNAGTDGACAIEEPTVVARLRIGCLERWPPVQDLCGRRRLHAGVLGARGGYVDVRRQSGS